MKIHILWVLYSYYHQNTVLYNTLVLGVPIFLGTSSTKRWRPGDFTIEAVVSYPVYRDQWVKMTFWPLWPHHDVWPHQCLCVSSGSGIGHCDQVWSKSDVGKYVKKTCCQKKKETRHCCRHRRRTLPGWPQADPRLTFDPLTKMEGLKLMLMYELYGHAMYHGELKHF